MSAASKYIVIMGQATGSTLRLVQGLGALFRLQSLQLVLRQGQSFTCSYSPRLGKRCHAFGCGHDFPRIGTTRGTGHILTPGRKDNDSAHLRRLENLLRLKALLCGPRNSNDPTCMVSLASSRQQQSVQRQRTGTANHQGNERSQIEQSRLVAGLPEMRPCSID